MGLAITIFFFLIILPVWCVNKKAGTAGLMVLAIAALLIAVLVACAEVSDVLVVVVECILLVIMIGFKIYCSTHKEEVAKSLYQDYMKQRERERAESAEHRRELGLDK